MGARLHQAQETKQGTVECTTAPVALAETAVGAGLSVAVKGLQHYAMRDVPLQLTHRLRDNDHPVQHPADASSPRACHTTSRLCEGTSGFHDCPLRSMCPTSSPQGHRCGAAAQLHHASPRPRCRCPLLPPPRVAALGIPWLQMDVKSTLCEDGQSTIEAIVQRITQNVMPSRLLRGFAYKIANAMHSTQAVTL